jgi:hypothetical protein
MLTRTSRSEAVPNPGDGAGAPGRYRSGADGRTAHDGDEPGEDGARTSRARTRLRGPIRARTRLALETGPNPERYRGSTDQMLDRGLGRTCGIEDERQCRGRALEEGWVDRGQASGHRWECWRAARGRTGADGGGGGRTRRRRAGAGGGCGDEKKELNLML